MVSIEQNEILFQKIEASLNTIRPYLKTDGGNVEVVDITDDMTLLVRLLGACESCPMSFTTMKAGIQETLKRDVPEIKSVVAVNSIKS